MSNGLEREMQNHSATDKQDSEISLFSLVIILVRYKKIVIGTPILAGLIAIAVSLMLTPVFTSTTKIMPPQQQSSGVAAMLGQLGGLAGAAGGLAGIKNPTDLYVGMLQSRTVADNLIHQFKLQQRYKSKTMEDARRTLARNSEIAGSKKDGFISISFTDKDPKFAAELANAYVNELNKLTQTLAVSEASQRRLFFEKQLKETKEQLTTAEIALRTTQEKTGMIQPEGQVQAIISSIAQLKGVIAAKEVQLKAMRTFATGQNPELIRAQEEIQALQTQLTNMEKNKSSRQGDFMVPTGKIPEAGIEYIRSLRNVKYYETIYEMLARQYEVAKIDEAKDSSIIQVLDLAIPSEQKSKPKRAIVAIIGTLLGCVLGIVLAFLAEFKRRSTGYPQNEYLRELSAAWQGK